MDHIDNLNACVVVLLCVTFDFDCCICTISSREKILQNQGNTSRQKWGNSWDTWIHSSDAGKIPSSRPVIGQAADTSQSQACYWEFFLHHLSGSKCLNYFPTFGELCSGRHPSLVTCVIISSTDTADTQRPDVARLENNLLDWYHITGRRLLIDCKNCAKFPANLSFIDYQPTHAALTRLGYNWHCQEPGAGGAWWRGLMRSLLAHHSALNLFCLARSWGK